MMLLISSGEGIYEKGTPIHTLTHVFIQEVCGSSAHSSRSCSFSSNSHHHSFIHSFIHAFSLSTHSTSVRSFNSSSDTSRTPSKVSQIERRDPATPKKDLWTYVRPIHPSMLSVQSRSPLSCQAGAFTSRPSRARRPTINSFSMQKTVRRLHSWLDKRCPSELLRVPSSLYLLVGGNRRSSSSNQSKRRQKFLPKGRTAQGSPLAPSRGGTGKAGSMEGSERRKDDTPVSPPRVDVWRGE
mmetsp:Transcript_31800/g.62977  ORF Transcript_31800/g.62977 Transcript_31800/m.62977 type:complete len:240 (-) Transcript_31800:621-1340(-)